MTDELEKLRAKVRAQYEADIRVRELGFDSQLCQGGISRLNWVLYEIEQLIAARQETNA